MRGFTILSIIYGSVLVYIGAISSMHITLKVVLFALIDFIFSKIINRRNDPCEERLSNVLIIYSIVLPITYGAFLILQHSNKNVKIFGIVLLIICLVTIIYFLYAFYKDIKSYMKNKFEVRIYLILSKIEGIDDKITFLQNEIEKLSGKDNEKIKFLEWNIIDCNLDKIDKIDDKIAFLQKELEELSEEDKNKKGYLEFKIKFFSKEKVKEDERIERENAEYEETMALYQERKRVQYEIVERLENKNFLETDLDRIFEKDEGCLLVLYNVVWNELGNKGELIKPRECEELYITNKRLFVRTIREMKAIVHFSQIIDIKAYNDGIVIHKPGPYFFIGINNEMDAYKANVCIEKAREYL